MTSIIIPAHNEEAGIARLLGGLVGDDARSDLEVVVVCNGCSDRTAEVARSFGPRVHVAELARPSKAAAVKHGDRLVTTFPRLYVDADIELTTRDVDALVATLSQPGIEAAAPRRILVRAGVSRLARAYYDVWEELPHVQAGLFGRGVLAVSERGFERIRALPEVMSDDLAISEAFSANERRIAGDAEARVRPARTWRALVHRRVRVRIGTHQLITAGLAGARSITHGSDLLRVVRMKPRLAARVPVFMATALWVRILARSRSRQGLADAWLRDDTSRDMRP